jgi:transcriptional regulator with XRE-family HTH domain
MIRNAREAADMTQREVGMRMPRFCDGNQVSRWERGEHAVDHDRLDALILVLRLDEEEAWSLWAQASMRKPKVRRREPVTAPDSESRELLELASQAGEVGAPSPRTTRRG